MVNRVKTAPDGIAVGGGLRFACFVILHKIRTFAHNYRTEVTAMKLYCGDTCPKTGRYKVVDENGKVVSSVYVCEGKTMPTTQRSDCHYEWEN